MENFKDLEEDPEVDELMDCVLGHYVKHHRIVLEKLWLAQRATVKTLEEITDSCDENQENKSIESLEQSREIWNKNIQMFIDTGVSEVGLTKIDSVLTTIPKTIKKNYDSLMEAETELLKAIDDLQSSADKYKEAYQRVQAIQAEPDKMSGLDPSHFDIEDDEIEPPVVQKAYKIVAPTDTTDSVH
jgi:hypothetical protein